MDLAFGFDQPSMFETEFLKYFNSSKFALLKLRKNGLTNKHYGLLLFVFVLHLVEDY
jgi:hypothetical protein